MNYYDFINDNSSSDEITISRCLIDIFTNERCGNTSPSFKNTSYCNEYLPFDGSEKCSSDNIAFVNCEK